MFVYTPLIFRAAAEEVERRLGKEAARNMHCHFIKIEFTDKGERRHHTLDQTRYGPRLRDVAEVIAEFRMQPVMTCEIPILDIDIMKMRDLC